MLQFRINFEQGRNQRTKQTKIWTNPALIAPGPEKVMAPESSKQPHIEQVRETTAPAGRELSSMNRPAEQVAIPGRVLSPEKQTFLNPISVHIGQTRSSPGEEHEAKLEHFCPFNGVVRSKIERFYVGYIDPESTDSGILQFLKDQSIHLTYVRLMKSRRDSTKSAQVNVVTSGYSEKLLDIYFWLRCRPWRSASQWYREEI